MINQKKEWGELFEYIKNKFSPERLRPPFVMYFFFVIIIIGLIGVFITIYDESNSNVFDHRNVGLNLSSYFVVLIASSAADLILHKEKHINSSIRMLGFCSLILGIVLLASSLLTNTIWSYLLSFIGIILAWSIWIIANSENEKFSDKPYVDDIKEKTKEHGQTWGDE